MAEGLMRHVAGASIDASSAGTAAGADINAESAAALLELGIDIRSHTTRPLTSDLVDAADLVVILGQDAQLDGREASVERWDTGEPANRGIQGVERMRIIRDDILERVRDLKRRLLEDR